MIPSPLNAPNSRLFIGFVASHLKYPNSYTGPAYARLEVIDNGPGISESVREWLFEPFSTTEDVGEGIGLRLWLC
jgi:signal transduction histidine kinase